jgi:hypothetical protein
MSFYQHGFLKPGRVLSDEGVGRLRAAIERARKEGGSVDLLSPQEWPEGEGGVPQEPGRTVGFLFNLWRTDPEFREVAFAPTLAGWASQLIGATQVRLLEDNVLVKDPETGGALRWHQDYPYWPLAQPSAVTAWIALDDVTADNGAVMVATGSHLTGERLPAVFGTGAVYGRDLRPKPVTPIGDPVELGWDVDVLTLQAGEVSFHHPLTWHCSGPNTTDRPRRAHVVRYVADGTVWFGARRYEFNYSDEQLGLVPGDRIGGEYFPLVTR